MDLLKNNPFISKGTANLSSSTIDYKEGDRVKHARFGEGTVTEMKPTGGDYQVTVAFDSAVGNRKMMASFAKLKKI